MNRSSLATALGMLVAVVITGCENNQSHIPSNPVNAKPTIQKWEYQTREGFAGTGGELNAYGDEGWEVCGVAGQNTIIFKRPKQ
jgi:hypothetical protein